LVRLIL